MIASKPRGGLLLWVWGVGLHVGIPYLIHLFHMCVIRFANKLFPNNEPHELQNGIRGTWHVEVNNQFKQNYGHRFLTGLSVLSDLIALIELINSISSIDSINKSLLPPTPRFPFEAIEWTETMEANLIYQVDPFKRFNRFNWKSGGADFRLKRLRWLIGSKRLKRSERLQRSRTCTPTQYIA